MKEIQMKRFVRVLTLVLMAAFLSSCSYCEAAGDEMRDEIPQGINSLKKTEAERREDLRKALSELPYQVTELDRSTFEDGIKKTSLKFCNEIVQLLGYGVGSTFLGWIVLSRENIMTVYRYGHHQRVMVHLRLTGSSSSPSLSKLACFDDSTFDNTKVSRISAGVYRITLPSSWFSSNDQIMVMAVSETAGVVAAVTARNTGYVDITIKGNVSHAVYDGEGSLDYYNTYLDSVDSGTVYIQIMNKSDWMLI